MAAETCFLFIGLTLSVATSVIWITFARLTMARIEREIAKDGLPRPSSWDGIGARTVSYAYAIALPVGRANRPDNPLIDVLLVRRYATRRDVLLGRAFLVCGNIWITIVLTGGWIFDLY